jgi:hypothetical protein
MLTAAVRPPTPPPPAPHLEGTCRAPGPGVPTQQHARPPRPRQPHILRLPRPAAL